MSTARIVVEFRPHVLLHVMEVLEARAVQEHGSLSNEATAEALRGVTRAYQGWKHCESVLTAFASVPGYAFRTLDDGRPDGLDHAVDQVLERLQQP